MKTNLWILIVAVLMIALTACETRVVMEQPGVEPRQNAISVQGATEFDVAPDLAKIRFSIETQSTTAQDAQLRNREIGANVESALLKAGIRRNEIETTGYRINRIQEWDPELRRSVDKGYRVTNTFIVSTTNLDRVGPLLDAGVQAGANRVESINFELSEAKQSEVKIDALRRATANAREKAEALAQGAGVRLGNLLSLSESSYVIMPYARADMERVAVMEAEAPPTAISPQDVRVSAQVSASYEIA